MKSGGEAMNGIAAGITLYEPELERLKENIDSVLPQVERVYLVDNASSNTAAFKAQYRNDTRITIIENSENAGIAKALNQMCDAAIEDGFDWILTLDQDSLPEPDMIEKYSRHTEMDEVAIITPRFEDDNEPQVISSESNKAYEQLHRCNTSASLLRLSAYKEVGGFDEEMFIDYVDFDFCTTLEEHGYMIIRDNEAVLHHRLGTAQEITFFIPLGRLLGIKKLQKPMFTYNHSPLRTYYFVRNLRYYIFKHRDSIDCCYERKVGIRWMALKLLFEKQRFAKLSAAVRGWRDGGKMIKKATSLMQSFEK